MKNNKIQDERILAERRKIQSTAYAWILTILLISVVVQQFFMNAPFAQFAVEFFILIGCGIFNTIATYKKGIDIWNSAGMGGKKLLLNTILSGIGSTIILALLSGNYNIKDLGLFFISFVVFSFLIHAIIIDMNKRKQQSIEKKLIDEDIIE